MKMKKVFVFLLPVYAAAGFILLNACKSPDNKSDSTVTTTKPSTTAAGLTLPSGFSAVVLAEKLKGPRHLAVTPQGEIYVKQSDGNGNGILVLHDDGDKATVKSHFGDYGGTGIAIKNGYLYATSNSDIYRYKLDDKGQVI